MIRSTIPQLHVIQQERQESRYTMQGQALTNTLHSLIRTYGTNSGDDYHINIEDLDRIDKVMLLSKFLDADDFEWAMKNETRLVQVFNEYKKHLQYLLDLETTDVFREDMREMGFYSSVDRENGEAIWHRR